VELRAPFNTVLSLVGSVATVVTAPLFQLPAVPVDIMLRLEITAAQTAAIVLMGPHVKAALLWMETEGF
jgi:hypothetical protein